MKAWSWFAITPAVLAGAYWATPVLVNSLTGHNAAAVTIAQLNLPVDEARPESKAAEARREINYASFGALGTNERKFIPRGKPVEMEFTLQSVMTSGNEGVAILNDKMVRQGDQVGGGYRVVKVEPNAVWLAITRTTSVKVGKKIKQETRDELKVVHFPELKDGDMPDTKLAGNTPTQPAAAVSPEQKAGQVELEKNYKQILEMLKL